MPEIMEKCADYWLNLRRLEMEELRAKIEKLPEAFPEYESDDHDTGYKHAKGDILDLLSVDLPAEPI